MKKIAPIFTLLLILASCSSENIEPGESNALGEFHASTEFNPVGEWSLVKISDSQSDIEKTGEEMEFFETYILNADGTFTKTRNEEKTTSETSGTFELIHFWQAINPEPVIAYVKFTHTSKNEIIFTCNDNLVEIFYFTPDHRLVSSRQTCENRVLTFRRIN